MTARREVILCAGAVDSPRLLMLSGIGPAGRLRDHGIELVADAPEVGRNLRDHLAAMLLVEAAEPGPDPRRAPGAFAQFRANGRGPLTSNLGEAYAFVRSDPALPHPDIELVLLTGQFVDEGRTRSQSAGFTLAVVLLQPRSRGEIALRDADPLSRPLIDPGYLSDPEDRRVLDAGLRIAEEVLATEPLASEAGAPVQPALPPARTAVTPPSRRRSPSTTRSGHAGWGPTRRRSWTNGSGCAACATCGWRTLPSCRRSCADTPPRRRCSSVSAPRN